MEEHISYFRECLKTNFVGEVEVLSPESRAQYEEWLADEQLLLQQALHQLGQEKTLEAASQYASEEEQIDAWMGPLPPIHVYRTSFEIEEAEVVKADFTSEEWETIQAKVTQIKEKYRLGLETGRMDNRHSLEPARRAWFKARVEQWNPDNRPEEVPSIFLEAECNVFGHICPVFFAAEALTETTESRRIGRRQIPFTTMMRIVRRDDYRCQHCKKQLRDDEVEFDHIIPVAKGGSSEEHNLRLICFDCNRDKSDDYIP